MRHPHPSIPRRGVLALGGALLAARALPAAADHGPARAHPDGPRRIFVVDSYDRGYIWSQQTQKGVNAAMRRLGYMHSDDEERRLDEADALETGHVVLRKAWMDTKRRNGRADIARATARIMAEIQAFRPHLVMLGDDNAANFIGNQLLDSPIPVVFWGINGLPLKYGLVQRIDAPGRNVTGVWQSGYYRESLDLLKKLVPAAQTFAILACDSETTRPSIKMIEELAARGSLPLRLVAKASTNSYALWKERALDFAARVDAMFVLNHDTLRDEDGGHVDMLAAGRWYLENIRVPEASHEDQFVLEGMLLTANDSGFNQCHLAFEMAHDILFKGLSPARMAVRTPERGPYMVNRNRATQLGIDLEDAMYLIDDLVETSRALDQG
ncbi:MAG: ABC transporter substrate-binding protein [Alphaproteobacteria bacterium]